MLHTIKKSLAIAVGLAFGSAYAVPSCVLFADSFEDNEAALPTCPLIPMVGVIKGKSGAIAGQLEGAPADYTYQVTDNSSPFTIVSDGSGGARLQLKPGKSISAAIGSQLSVEVTATPKKPIGGGGAYTFQMQVFVAGTKLNDTGMTWGIAADGSKNTTCVGETIGAQDCANGRDAQAAAGKLSKIGSGRAGFDFSKIGNAGNFMTADATNHRCVRDNVTGLLWEVKTDDGGLQDKDNTYTWYNPDSQTNGGDAGTQNGGECHGGIACDTASYIQAINTNKLCNATTWRLPTLTEMLSIIDFSEIKDGGEPIDTGFFTQLNLKKPYFSSEITEKKSSVRTVDYLTGFGLYGIEKNNSAAVMLVSE